ncbi:MAG: LysR family transcriptional regulator [Dehalococcoidia bacterium]|nr:LysR family transcriptional regulator [Dehalococcoidia bacterium]
MDLAQLEAFLEASRWGSFRRAAAALFLSQPSLSERWC